MKSGSERDVVSRAATTTTKKKPEERKWIQETARGPSSLWIFKLRP